LVQAAELLHELVVEKKKRVYVHCTEGRERAVAVVLAYLYIYKGMSVEEGDQYVKRFRPQAHPDLDIVRKALLSVMREKQKREEFEQVK
jgi:protein-tyrosine phosphatase